MKLECLIVESLTVPIFVDLDGVLVDFVRNANKVLQHYKKDTYDHSRYEASKKYRDECWDLIRKYQKEHGKVFWLEMEKMKDADTLWQYLHKFKPEILTAAGQTNLEASDQKKEWVKKHLGNVVTHVVSTSKDKAQFATKDAILIDDREKSIKPWITAGGIGILHTSANNTIEQLKKLGIK